jgi:hypothetical protein
MVVSSLKIAWHVPPMPGDRFNLEYVLITFRLDKLTENCSHKISSRTGSKLV